ncbi:Signal transduction histidine-protein kinase AtoS, partial [Marine Group I thaumarchaeote SCGC AAA799-P11]
MNEIKDYAYVKLPDSDPTKKLNELEQNILLLKFGGEVDGLKLNPLDTQFDQDWQLVYDQFKKTKADYEDFKLSSFEQELSPYSLNTLQIDSFILIDHSDKLVNKIGVLIDKTSQMLITLQIILVIVNVVAHVELIILVSKIFNNEFKKNLRMEKLATVGELSSRLAHDMRNPLSYINMSTQLIKSKTSEKETAEKLAIIEKGVSRMSHQINDVMDFVRTKEPDLKLWDLKSILEECFDRLKLPNSVKVTLPERSLLVKCDRTQFEVLFLNLISNAVDSIKNDGSIEVRTHTSPNEIKIEII